MNDVLIWKIYVTVWLTVLGAVAGSFLACTVSRWLLGKAPLGRSFCGSCGQTLAARDLVPIFSYLRYGGVCRYCGSRIPVSCIASELAGAAAFACVGWRFAASPELPQWLIFAGILLALSLIDCEEKILPNGLLLALLANRVVWFFVLGQLSLPALANILLACTIPAVLLVAVLIAERFTFCEVMGGGDLKLLIVYAFYLNWAQLLLTVLVSSLIGLAAAAAGKMRRGEALPFGPFLAAGALTTVCFGTPLIDWYVSLLCW